MISHQMKNRAFYICKHDGKYRVIQNPDTTPLMPYYFEYDTYQQARKGLINLERIYQIQ